MQRIIGVHEEEPAGKTAERFPGHGWGRGFARWSKTVAPMPVTATAQQVIERLDAVTRDDLAAGGGNIVSLKISPYDVAAGKWDVKLAEVGRWTVGKRLIVVFWHEPEDNHTGKAFADGFNRARTCLKRGNPDLLVGWAAMAYQWSLKNGSTADVAAWQAVDADLYLVDVYSGNTFRPDCIMPEHPGFVRWFASIIEPFPARLLKWGVGERGFAAGPLRAASWRRELVWLLNDPVGKTCSVYVPWGTGGTEKSAAWPFGDDPDTTAVVREIMAALSKPAAPPAPAGYSNTYTAGILLHEATGAAVFDTHVAEWNAFVERVRVTSAAIAAASAAVQAGKA